MLWHIAKKEFFQNLLTSRFIIGMLLCTIFVVIIKISLLGEYRILVDAYHDSVRTNEELLQNYYTYSEINPSVHKPPEILSIFAGSVGRKLGGIITIPRGEIPYDASHYVLDNPFLKVFTSVDIVLVFKLVLSLLAILFAFDMFSGEKERGTLKLTLVGNISRSQVFFGKYLGGMMSLFIALLISFIFGLLFFTISTVASINTELLTRMLLIYFVSTLFVASFFSIGSLISVLTHRSVTSLAVSLFLWVTLTIALPNLGDYTASKLKTIRPVKSIEAQVEALNDEFRGELSEFYDQNRPEGGTVINGSINTIAGVYRFQISNLANMEYYEQFVPFSENIRMEYGNRKYAVRKSYLDEMHDQAKFVNSFVLYTPVRLYENIASIIARTDLETFFDFINQAQIYREQMLDYFDDKDVYHKYRFMTIMERGEAPDITSGSVFTDGSEGRRIWDALDERVDYTTRPPLNLDDFPRFSYRPEKLADSIVRALPNFLALVLIVIILMSLNYFLFLRYDVR